MNLRLEIPNLLRHLVFVIFSFTPTYARFGLKCGDGSVIEFIQILDFFGFRRHVASKKISYLSSNFEPMVDLCFKAFRKGQQGRRKCLGPTNLWFVFENIIITQTLFDSNATIEKNERNDNKTNEYNDVANLRIKKIWSMGWKMINLETLMAEVTIRAK